MVDQENWLRRYHDLHEAGKVDEARLLYIENTTEQERAEQAASNARIFALLDVLRPGLDKVRAAEADPDNPKSQPWLALKNSSVSVPDAMAMYAHFPNPAETRGRPAGKGEIARDVERMAAIAAVTGKPAREIARAILIERHGADWVYLDRRSREMVTAFNRRA